MGCFSSKEAPPVDHPVKREEPRNPSPALPPVPRAKPVITEADMAKHKLKHQRDALERSLKLSEEVLNRDLALAAQLRREGKKESALVLLRRRKLVQERVKVTSAQLGKIQDSIGTIEGAENLKAVLEAVEQGTKAMEKLNSVVTVQKAEEVMAKSRDATAYTEEVAAVLAGADDVPDLDEDEVLKEIEEYERGVEGAHQQKVAEKDQMLSDMPNIPTTIPEPPGMPQDTEVVVEESKPMARAAVPA